MHSACVYQRVGHAGVPRPPPEVSKYPTLLPICRGSGQFRPIHRVEYRLTRYLREAVMSVHPAYS